MNVLEQLVVWSQDLLYTLGYIGIGLLIALETVVPPIPSEVVLPLAGSLSAQGRFHIVLAIAAATAGSMVGALFLYSLSRWAGQARLERWVDRYGKWVLLSRGDINKATGWFNRYGTYAVLIGRFIPGVRSIVSIPAGLSGMPLGRFVGFTLLGNTIWNTTLVSAGYLLGQNWTHIEAIVSPFSKVVYVAIGLAVILFFSSRFLRKRRLVPVEADRRIEE
jgi:membrane protein DedA with SNARE-associated domain